MLFLVFDIMKRASQQICIIDYGGGNVQSVKNAFDFLGFKVCISNSLAAVDSSTHLILAGVGSYGSMMAKLKNAISLDELNEQVLVKNKPILGICVGMQIMYQCGEEFGNHEGLGWLQGNVVEINTRGKRLPHVGWNYVNKSPGTNSKNFLFENGDAYFLHSYAVSNFSSDEVLATTNYGDEFASVAKRKNIYGVQFHPEKSQGFGLNILNQFGHTE